MKTEQLNPPAVRLQLEIHDRIEQALFKAINEVSGDSIGSIVEELAEMKPWQRDAILQAIEEEGFAMLVTEAMANAINTVKWCRLRSADH